MYKNKIIDIDIVFIKNTIIMNLKKTLYYIVKNIITTEYTKL